MIEWECGTVPLNIPAFDPIEAGCDIVPNFLIFLCSDSLCQIGSVEYRTS